MVAITQEEVNARREMFRIKMLMAQARARRRQLEQERKDNVVRRIA